MRKCADAGDEQAAYRLASLLAEQGRIDELRHEVYAGTKYAVERLINALASRAETKQEAARMRRFGLNLDGSIAERD